MFKLMTRTALTCEQRFTRQLRVQGGVGKRFLESARHNDIVEQRSGYCFTYQCSEGG